MIIAYTGKTGSGKTFKMIKKAYKRWLAGEDIYSNTVLYFEKFGGAAGSEVHDLLFFLRKLPIPNTWKTRLEKRRGSKRGRITYFEDITEILEAKDGVILFDEAQVLFSARQWETLPAEFQYKLQQHRKHRLDLYCTAQNMGTIDIMYRRLVQYWYHCERLIQIGKHLSWLGLYIVRTKDVDQLYNSVDDLVVDNIRTRPFFITFLTRRLYDTFYDIGFRRFKTIWSIYLDDQMRSKKTWIIMPKNKQLKDVLREISTLKSRLNLKTYPNSRKNLRSYVTNI